jgi:hypothetical protein
MNPEVALAKIRAMKSLMEEIDKRRASPSAAMQAEEFGRVDAGTKGHLGTNHRERAGALLAETSIAC